MDPSGCFKPTPHWYSTPPLSVGMQPGVCFGKETNLLTGERLVFLVETFIDGKGLFCTPKLTNWRCPSFGLKAVERENKGFPPETNVSPANK